MRGLLKEIICFEITGGPSERFLNIANHRRLNIFNISRQGDRTFAFTPAKEYPSVCAAAAKADTELAVVSRYGLIFRLRKYRARWGFFAGFAIFCLLMWVMSLFVWSVDIENLPEEYAVSVTDLLYEEGIRIGVLGTSIDGEMLELSLEEKLPQFDMIKVSRMGCKARVQFDAAVPVHHRVEENSPCDLIARESGQIVSATASKGTIFVKEGDIVVPGDVLISGVFDFLGESIVMVHAEGNVTALVEQTFSETVRYGQTVTEPTGHIVNINRIMAFGLEIPLFGSLPKGLYRRTYEEIPLSVWGFDFPILLRREEWKELCYTERELSYEDCVRQAADKVQKKIEQADYSEIVSRNRVVSKTDSGVRVTEYVTFIRDITEERGLLVDPLPEKEESSEEDGEEWER